MEGKYVINNTLPALAKDLLELIATSNISLLPPVSVESKVFEELMWPFSGLYYHFRNAAKVLKILKRVKNMDGNLTFPLTPGNEYEEYIKAIGFGKHHIQYCYQLLTGMAVDKHDCTDELRQVVVNYRPCVVLDSFQGGVPSIAVQNVLTSNESAIYKVRIELQQRDFNWAVSESYMVLYDREEKPSLMHDVLQYYSPITKTQDMYMTLREVEAFEYLFPPYNDPPCIASTKARCMEECWANGSRRDCRDYYLKDINSTKPLCKIFDTNNPESFCPHCGFTCVKKKFGIELMWLPGKSDAPKYGIHLTPDYTLKYQIYRQVPLYGASSLFAELGGTMGLFIGASVLTLYHCAEHIWLSIWKACQKLYTSLCAGRGTGKHVVRTNVLLVGDGTILNRDHLYY